MTASSSGVYDFLSDENAELWKGVLQPALRKVGDILMLVMLINTNRTILNTVFF